MREESERTNSAERRKPVTAGYLERAAVYYLERFSSTAENLRRVLLRKAKRRSGLKPGPEIAALVSATVEKAVRSGLVDDAAFADAKLNSLLRRGASTRKARATLAAKGVPPETAGAALSERAPDDAAQARRYAERKRLGSWRQPPDPAKRERDLAALCRAGFPYRLAVAALEAGPQEES